jgi:hypothetical protein
VAARYSLNKLREMDEVTTLRIIGCCRRHFGNDADAAANVSSGVGRTGHAHSVGHRLAAIAKETGPAWES